MLFLQSTIGAGTEFNKCHHEILRRSETFHSAVALKSRMSAYGNFHSPETKRHLPRACCDSSTQTSRPHNRRNAPTRKSVSIRHSWNCCARSMPAPLNRAPREDSESL